LLVLVVIALLAVLIGLNVLFAQAPEHWLDRVLHALADQAPADTFFSFGFNLRALLALVLVSLTCGAVGSLVVGGRMAFFSDALAHCAFAGVSIGFLVSEYLLGGAHSATEFWAWVTPIMVAFGLLVGFGIATVRQRTGLASDTVIGVFFAGSVGLAAMLRTLIRKRQLMNLEDFLFGDPLLVNASELVHLALLLLLTTAVLWLTYNQLLLASFHGSLARSRRVPVRLVNTLFVMLLAAIVNLCVRAVGVLLINALLVVPAATAINLSRNMRRFFWLTLGLCLGCSLAGQWLSWEMEARRDIPLGIPGTIVLISVALFLVSMLLRPWWRGRGEAVTSG
jgi:zinc transport system permease protein